MVLNHPTESIFVPVTDIAFPDAIVGQFFGVDIPADVPFYDVRTSDDFEWPKVDYGETLFSGERIAYKLKLRTGWYPQINDTSMVGAEWYFDARDPINADSVARNVRWLIAEFQARMKLYDLAERYHSKKQGGSVYYKPVFCYVCNFGGSLIGTRENYRVVAFNGNDEFDRQRRQLMKKLQR